MLVVSSHDTISHDVFISKTLVSDMRHVSKLLVPGFGRPVLLRRVKMPRTLHSYEMVTEHFANPNLSVFVSKCCVLEFAV